MTTYNNLEIAQVSLTFSGELDPSISTRTFDLSTLNFLPNVPLIDQIEVERIFDTGYDTKFSENIFTIADRRQLFILPKAWYSINEQTKVKIDYDEFASLLKQYPHHTITRDNEDSFCDFDVMVYKDSKGNVFAVHTKQEMYDESESYGFRNTYYRCTF